MRKLLILFLLFTSNAFAAVDSKIVNDIEKYFHDLNNVVIDFTQVDQHGKESSGKFILNKPHNFRWNYFAPSPLLITGGKNFVSFYDYDLEQISRIKAKDNILQFLLRQEPFAHHFDILNTYQKAGNKHIVIKDREYEKTVHIAINHKNHLELIEIIEPDTTVTKISFANILKAHKFAPELFSIRDPDIFGAPPQLSPEELAKKYSLVQ